MRNHISPTSRRVTRSAGLGAAIAVVLASSVSAATFAVDVNDGKFFSPKTLTQSPGGSVHWHASGVDDHTVTSDQLLFDTGTARPGVDFARTFSAGTFPYHCREHGDQGMRGVVKVAPQATAAPSGLPFTVKWASAGSNTGDRYDVLYKVGSGPFRTWLSGTGAAAKVFGARSTPVKLARGKTYTFKVRSRAGTRASGYSPTRSFKAS